MTGPDASVGRAAAAMEQVDAAQREVAGLSAELEGVCVRLLVTSDILWSGAAARAWRGSLERARDDVRTGVGELDELRDLLTALQRGLGA